MKRSQFQRVWEEAQLEIAEIRAQLASADAKFAHIQNIHSDLYEGVTGEPAPSRMRRSA